jgi:hypothetical protein
MSNREVYPSQLFPLRGDLSAEAGDVIVEVIGLQHIPIAPNPLQEWAVLTDRPSHGDLEWLTPIFNEGNVNFASLIPGDVIVWNGFQWVNAGLPAVESLYLPVFTNNAAAISGGLVAGNLYRTGGDPDLVAVVH